MQIRINDVSESYHEIVTYVMEQGDEVAPRGLPTRELLNFSLELTDPTRSYASGVGRNLNGKIAAIEALQLIGGFIDPQAMLRASSAFRDFMDGGTFHGGYGQRTRGQMLAMMEKLRSDPDTRQAIVTLWDPVHDLFTPGMHDYPCTVALQFLIRNERLVMMTHMRSNDVWRGLPYDLVVFTQLQQAVASHLNYQLGSYFHHVSSLHMYESDAEAADWMLSQDEYTPRGQHTQLGPLFCGSVPWEIVQEVCLDIAQRRSTDRHHTWLHKGMVQWYRERM